MKEYTQYKIYICIKLIKSTMTVYSIANHISILALFQSIELVSCMH